MNRKAIVTKTAKGMREARGTTHSLGRDLKAFLKAVDGKSTPDDLAKRLGQTESAFGDTLERLVAEGYVQEVPLGTSEDWDLDFTRSSIVADVQSEVRAEARRKAEETSRRWAAERAKRRADERERREAEKRAQHEAAERAAREARKQAHLAAEKAAAERVQREAEELARREAEARAMREAQERARRAAKEAARKAAAEQARREAEEARRVAEARARRAAEERARREAEALARREAEELARREAEARAMREAQERARRAAEEAAQKAAAEQAQREAEERARREAEEARQERARQEAEALAQREAEEQARREAEERMRLEEEARARRAAEEQVRREAEAQARRQAEELAMREAEARALSAAREHIRLAAETIASKRADHREWGDIGPLDGGAAAQAGWERAACESRRGERKGREREAPERDADLRVTRHAEREARKAPAAVAEKSALHRPPLRWARPLALSLLVFLTAGLLLLHLMPFDSQRARFETIAAEQFQQPVSIRAVHFSLLPRPHWNLDEVTIGGGRQVQAPRIRVFAGPDALLRGAGAFEAIELEAPVLTEDGLAWLLLGKAHGRGLSAKRVEAHGAVLRANKLALPPFDVHAEFGDDGNWRRMQLGFTGIDLAVSLAPADDAVSFSLQSTAFAPSFLPGLPALGDFRAEGTARRGELQVTRFEGRIHGGGVAGSARLRFDDHMALEGDVNARNIDIAQLIPGLFEAGLLDGAAIFVLPVHGAGQTAPRVAGSFAVRRGIVGGVDMGSALKDKGLGGSTRFGRLDGSLAAENGRVQLRHLQLDAGAMSATGNVDVAADRSLHGRIEVALAVAAIRRHVVLDLSGAFKEPYLKNAAWTRR
jgi:hypothetical protein